MKDGKKMREPAVSSRKYRKEEEEEEVAFGRAGSPNLSPSLPSPPS